jgi:hypothetical protein
MVGNLPGQSAGEEAAVDRIEARTRGIVDADADCEPG